MPPFVHAESDSAFKLVFYFIVFVLWIVAQAVAASKKKKRQQEMERNLDREPVGGPQETTTPPIDTDLKDLLEQLTGQSLPSQPPPRPAPAPPMQRTPPPAPVRLPVPAQAPRQSDAARQQLRPVRRAAPIRATPPPVPQLSRSETWISPTSAPATAFAAPVSVHPRELSVNLPKTRLPTIRLPSINIQRATAHAGRVAWLKSPHTLRQSMVARMVLDPPKAVEFTLR